MTTHDRLLAGRYELINEIGHDDLTVAYRALDTHEKSNLGEARTVLVKVVRAQYNESPHVLQRFLELAAADEELRGPHVADVYHSGEDSGVYYLVAEWVDGPSLRRVLDERAAAGQPLMPPLDAVKLALQILAALEQAHNLRILHGSLCPENVLINQHGRAQVSDFGLCLALSPQDGAPQPPAPAAGSAAYQAPEQVRGQATDIACDIFAMGVMLLEMVAGTQARDAVAAWRLARNPSSNAVLPHTLVPDLPVMLESVMLRSLRYHPAERYASAAEMTRDLEAFVQTHGEQTVAVPPPRVVVSAPPRVPAVPEPVVVRTVPVVPATALWRPSWPAGLVAALLAILLCAAVGYGLRAFMPPTRTTTLVPNLVGRSRQDAARVAASDGLTVTVTEERDDAGQPPDTVLSQIPPAGDRLPVGGAVQIVVVRAAPTPAAVSKVPNITGQSEAGARLLIEAAGFKVGAVIHRADPNTAAGIVVEQNPRADLQLAPGSSVDLVVSDGPPAQPATIAPLFPTAAPPAVPPVNGCGGDEQMSFNPPAPALNQPVLIDVYSSAGHTGVAITGPGSISGGSLAREGNRWHWQWQVVPTQPGHYEFVFTVNNGVPCARGVFDIGSTVPVGSNPTSAPPLPAGPTAGPGATLAPPAATLAPGTIMMVAAWGSEGSGNGALRAPAALAVGGNSVYVADSGNDRIEVFDANGAFQASWGGSGSAVGQFAHPSGIALRPDGTLIVADTNNQRLQLLDAQGHALQSWGVEGSSPGQFRRPHGLAVDAQGYVYVADTNNHRVQKIDPGGTVVLQFGLLGPGLGQFNHPWGIALDAAGAIYVADSDNHRVQKFASDGRYQASWGGFGSGDGQFNGPTGITVDAHGNVYVTDSGNARVQVFDSSGRWLARWGSAGTGGGQFASPYGIAFGPDGALYVADSGNNRVQKFR